MLQEEMTNTSIVTAILNRRSTFHRDFLKQDIPREKLETLVECANAAPNHKRTQPWRFVVYRAGGLEKLATLLGNAYVEHTPAERFLEKSKDALQSKAREAGAVIAINVAYSGAVPAWEEVAATAAAVQNMWLATAELGLSGYWGSPGIIQHLKPALNLAENEECLGFLYLGVPQPEMEAPRPKLPLEHRVLWEEQA